MPRTRKMTWQEGSKSRSGRWRKKYKNRVFHAAGGRGKRDDEAYEKAWEGFKQFKEEVDKEEAQKPKPNQAEYEAAIAEWKLVLQWSVAHGDQQYAPVARQKIESLQTRLEQPKLEPLDAKDRFWSQLGWPAPVRESVAALIPAPPPPDPASVRTVIPSELALASSMDGTPQRIEHEVWQDRIRIQGQKVEEALDTLATSVDSFLARKRAQVNAGEITAGRYDPVRGHLFHFRDWLGAAVSLSSISGKVITDYHAELLNAVSEKRLSADYAKDRLGTVKSFVQWLWRIEAIDELPRVLGPGNNDLRISKKVSTPEVFTVDEVKALLKAATERTKLYLLLMLNTGSTQKDISDLLPSEVDWKRGTITRKRSKTAKHKNVPTVSYHLWEETLRLLKQEHAPGAATVLVNEGGGPLKVESLTDDGKLQKIDNIATAFGRLRRKTKINKPLKYFRKTSANLLKSNRDFRGLEVLFLGHAPATIEERHYTQAPQQLLDEAITWLGTQYGLDEK